MTMPLLITLAGALIGNLLGYTLMKNVCAGMYYGSYNLPTYVTVWNGEALLLTTLVPIIMMLLIQRIFFGYRNHGYQRGLCRFCN